MSDLQGALVLREKAVLLNRATDELNNALIRAEQALADTGLGVEAEVTFGVEPEIRFLAFAKMPSGWRLVIEQENGRSDLLLNASRTDRILAARLLPGLVQALVANAEQLTSDVDGATNVCDGVVAKLRERRGQNATREGEAAVADALAVAILSAPTAPVAPRVIRRRRMKAVPVLSLLEEPAR